MIIQLKDVKRLSGFNEDSFRESLPQAEFMPWLKARSTSADEVAGEIAATYPADGQEVVDWMHMAAAANTVLNVFEASYEDAGGEIRSRAGDGNIPGVYVDRDLYFVSNIGMVVRRRGYAEVVAERARRFRVRVRNARTIATRRLLGWAAVPTAWHVQYLGILIKYSRLARAPIRRRVPFPYFYGHNAPLFIRVSSPVPAPARLLRMRLTSKIGRRMHIRVRSTSDYEKILGETEFDMEQGEAEYTVLINTFPYIVSSFVLELQPVGVDMVALDLLEVYP